MKTETFTLNYTTCAENGGVGVVIPAAGSSTRMQGVDKLFTELQGVPVIVRTLQAFQKHPLVQSIVLVTRKDSILKLQQLVASYGLTKVTDILPGGANRAESVRAGFEALAAQGRQTVLIHDGARPLVSAEVISRVIAGVEEFAAAAAAVPVKDSIKQVGSLGKILKDVPRSALCAMQTPQGFLTENYAEALKTVASADFTDDCALMEKAGFAVYTVPGDYKNIKLTTPEDFIIAEAFLREEN